LLGISIDFGSLLTEHIDIKIKKIKKNKKEKKMKIFLCVSRDFIFNTKIVGTLPPLKGDHLLPSLFALPTGIFPTYASPVFLRIFNLPHLERNFNFSRKKQQDAKIKMGPGKYLRNKTPDPVTTVTSHQAYFTLIYDSFTKFSISTSN
jgi:hypothetical protein